jgi:hypothetical protein
MCLHVPHGLGQCPRSASIDQAPAPPTISAIARPSARRWYSTTLTLLGAEPVHEKAVLLVHHDRYEHDHGDRSAATRVSNPDGQAEGAQELGRDREEGEGGHPSAFCAP